MERTKDAGIRDGKQDGGCCWRTIRLSHHHVTEIRLWRDLPNAGMYGGTKSEHDSCDMKIFQDLRCTEYMLLEWQETLVDFVSDEMSPSNTTNYGDIMIPDIVSIA